MQQQFTFAPIRRLQASDKICQVLP